MPNRAYNRSVKRERELVNNLRKVGVAARSAGSKSPWDVWSITGNRVEVFQIKTKKGGRRANIKKLREYPGTIIEYLVTYY